MIDEQDLNWTVDHTGREIARECDMLYGVAGCTVHPGKRIAHVEDPKYGPLVAAAPNLAKALALAVVQLKRFASAGATDQLQQHWDEESALALHLALCALGKSKD